MPKMLITKLVLEQGKTVALYERGHKFKDTTLFDASDLADVGIDYADLQVGVEVPCRFWAVWQESDKLNKAGNPYKDVKTLEPYGAGRGGDPPAPGDLADILAELRAIRQLLAQALHVEGLPASGRGGDLPAPEPPPIDLPEGMSFEDEDDEPAPEDPGNGYLPLNADQARREFGSTAGPAVRARQITQARVTGLVQMAKVKGWRDALTILEMEIDAVKEIA